MPRLPVFGWLAEFQQSDDYIMAAPSRQRQVPVRQEFVRLVENTFIWVNDLPSLATLSR